MSQSLHKLDTIPSKFMKLNIHHRIVLEIMSHILNKKVIQVFNLEVSRTDQSKSNEASIDYGFS